jgi:hypothetical protein
MPRLIRPVAYCLCVALTLAAVAPAHAQSATGTATWFGAQNQNWSNAANWSTTPPAFFPNNGTGATNWDVTVNTVSFGSITLDTNITIRQLTFTGNNTFSELTGGTTAAPTNLTMTGLFTWTGGALAGAGTITANGGMTLNTSSSTITILDGRTLTLGADSSWASTTGGNLRLNNGAVLTVGASTTFSLQNDRSIVSDTGNGQITVNGTLRKQSGSGTTNVVVPVTVNGTGTMSAQSGTLSLQAGGTGAGTYTAGPGATLQFGAGTYAVSGSITGDATGKVDVAGGTVNLSGTMNFPGTFTVSASVATVNFQSGATTTAIGATGVTGTLNFNTGHAVTLAGLTLNGGTLTTADALSVTGSLALSGGTVSGPGGVTANGGGTGFGVTLQNGAVLTIPAGTQFQSSQTFANGGGAAPRIDVSGTMNGGGSFGVPVTTAAVGLIDASVGGAMTFSAGLTNAGTTRASASGGNVIITGPATNGGTLSSEDPGGGSLVTVNLASGTFTNTGTVQAVTGSQVTFSPGSSGTSITNNGTFLASGGGTILVDDAAPFTNFSGGTLTGGTYRAVSGGTIALGSRTVATIGPNTTVELNGATASFPALNALTTNNGTFKILGGRTFSVPDSGSGPVLTNSGSLVVGQTAGDGSTLNGTVTLTGSGTISGTGTITGGVSVPSGSTLGGSTTINGSVTVAAGGTVAPGNSPGTLTVGGVTFTGGTLAVELNGTTVGTQYDRLASTAGVALGSGVTTLTTSLGYAPSSGDVLTIVTAASPVTGTFANLPNNQTFPVGSFGGVPYTATILYNPSSTNSVALTNFAPVPEPATAFLVCAAGAAVAARLRRRR